MTIFSTLKPISASNLLKDSFEDGYNKFVTAFMPIAEAVDPSDKVTFDFEEGGNAKVAKSPAARRTSLILCLVLLDASTGLPVLGSVRVTPKGSVGSGAPSSLSVGTFPTQFRSKSLSLLRGMVS